MNTTKLSSKRKVPDVNDNFDVFAAPAAPALRNVHVHNSRRMTIAGGTLPPTPAQLAQQGNLAFAAHGSQTRRQAEEDHADSLYNNYVTALALKLRTQKHAARIRHEVDAQLSTLQLECVRMRQLFAESSRKQDVLAALVSTASMVQQLQAMLAQNSLMQFHGLESLPSSVNGHMNSLKCVHVRTLGVHGEFGNVEESLNELSENFCIPHEAMEICLTAVNRLLEIGNSMNTAEEVNKCLNQLKESINCLLFKYFASSKQLL